MGASKETDNLTRKDEIAVDFVTKKHHTSASSASGTNKNKSKVVTIGWISAFLSLISAITTLLWPNILDAGLQTALAISKDSPIYELWVNSTIPVHMEIHFFNCTNPGDILQKRAKPKFSQLGPYVFREYDNKVDIEFTDHFTVKYNLTKTWIFQPQLSNGTMDDHVTSVDLIAYTAAFNVRNSSSSMRHFMSYVLSLYRYNTFSAHTVRELLFDGYSDPLLTANYIIPVLDVPQDKMGYLYSRNGTSTYEGRYEVNTGVDYLNKFGKLLNWNGKTHFVLYEGECDRINKGLVESVVPRITKETILAIFSRDLCRTLIMPFKEESKFKGLSTYRFWSDGNAFSKGSVNPDNLCYERDDDPSFPNGVWYIGRCIRGPPLLVSPPHFFNTDPSLVEAVEGLEPKEELHMTYYDLDPLTAVPVKGVGNIQINLALEPVEGVSLFANVPTVVFPVLWISKKSDFTDELITLIKLASSLEFGIRVGLLVLLCVSVNVLVICLFIRFYKQVKMKAAITNVLYMEVQQVLK